MSKAAMMLTISRLGHRSITYYNDTANQAKHAATKHQTTGGRTRRVLLGRRNPRPQLARRRRQTTYRGRDRPWLFSP